MPSPSPKPQTPSAQPEPFVYRVADVAARWRISEEHVSDLIDEGKLQAINIGNGSRNYWRIPRESLHRFELENDSLFDRTTGSLLPPRPVIRGKNDSRG